jgi:prevent-host-death family protein
MEVGIRDLRNQLSKYLAGVAQGDELVVTDHGQAVARILPINVPRPIDRLVSEGLVQPSPGKPRSRPIRRIKTKQPVSELVAEQRR